MLYNYIFVYKSISFKIMSPATFVNKSHKLLTLNVRNICAVNRHVRDFLLHIYMYMNYFKCEHYFRWQS